MSAEVLVSSVQFMRRRKSSFVLKISVTGNDRSLTLTKGMFLTWVISKSEVLGMEKDAT